MERRGERREEGVEARRESRVWERWEASEEETEMSK